MKYFPPLLLAICMIGCSIAASRHAPGGPYYFARAITYQGYNPTDELTKAQAEELASRGYAYYVGYFDAVGRLSRIVKVYRGETVLDKEVTYDTNGRMVAAREGVSDQNEEMRASQPSDAATR